MRIVFFGSPTESADSLDSLILDGHDIAAVYSQPDRRAGRGRTNVATPVKATGLDRGLSVFTPKGLRNNGEEVTRLTELHADVFIVVAYGRILPPEVLQIPPMGVVNIHPSLLPSYRGPSPVVAAILDGMSETGVTIMLLDEGMDTGPVLAQSKPIRLLGTERGAELQRTLFKEGTKLLPGALHGLQAGSITPQPQDDTLATVTSLIERGDGEINWSASAEQIDRMVRAYDPWPGTFTIWNGKGLKILEVALVRGSPFGTEASSRLGSAGSVSVTEGRLVVATSHGILEILRLQLEGRQVVPAADFLRGNPDIDGGVLGG
jgi:methionyl-tRNA formyltransferase